MRKEPATDDKPQRKGMSLGSDRPGIVVYAAAVTVIATALYASTLHSYLFFHSLIEITSIAIAFSLFTLTWHARRFLTVGPLKILGIGYGLIAVIDLLHTLAYKGMGVFPDYGANLPTQLWIAARYLQALLLCVAPLFARRNINEQLFFGISLAAVSATAALVFSGAFPDCFIEGEGLTPFKIVSEYVISASLLFALILFIRIRSAFKVGTFTLISASILCTIGSELAFTSYLNVYGFANMVGHLLKLAAFYLIYRALIVTGIKEPLELIFRGLKEAEDALLKSHDSLEEKVRERTEELRTSEEKYRTLIECANDAVFIHEITEDGMPGPFIEVNELACRRLGYSREDLVRMGPMELDDPRYRHRIASAMEQLLKDGHVVFETAQIDKDGHSIPVEVSTRVLELKGKRLLFSIVRDLAERKQAEEKLKEQLLFLQQLLDSIPIPVFYKDLDGLYLGCNTAFEATIDMPRSDIVGKTVHQILTKERADIHHEMDLALFRSPGVQKYEVSGVYNDGKLHHAIFNKATFVGADNRVAGIVGASIDITDRKLAEEESRYLKEALEQRVASRTRELEETQGALMNIVEDLNEKTTELEEANVKLKDLDRLKSMFIASMSHELRTPLNSIIGFSSILHDEWLGSVNAEQKENLAIIRQSGRHLLNLINDVIDVSKIEAGKIESLVEEFDIRDLVGEAVEMVGKEAVEKGLVVHVDASGLLMRTDRRRLLQCVLNLLSNAIKYTGKGSVTVEARALQDGGKTGMVGRAEISVADTGIGIREEDAERLFQPFVRLGSPLMTTVPGTGLGLYLSRKLAVEVLKGEISFSSEFGRGSRFVIRVPARLS